MVRTQLQRLLGKLFHGLANRFLSVRIRTNETVSLAMALAIASFASGFVMVIYRG
jgi:hypothetical protein